MYLLLNFLLLLISILSLIYIKKLPSSLIIFDQPDQTRKLHSIPVPLFGGIIFFIFVILNTLFFYNEINFSLKIILIFLYLFFFSLGFIDDRFSLSPAKKTFLILIFLSLTLPLNEKLIINLLVFKDIELIINLNQANIFFTIFSIYFFYNIINFSDGANGITVSLSIFWLIIFVFFGSINKFYLYALIAPLVLILIFNLKGKIFIGNSGSNLIAIVLAYLFIYNYNMDQSIRVDEIFLLMFLPAVDSLRVIIERVINGKSPLQPDMTHLHHLLLKKFSKKIVFLPYLIFAALPFMLSIYFNTITISVICLIIYFIVYFILNKKII